MENVFAPYECQFDNEERKKIVSDTLQELRKARGYSQKEVAAFLNMSQPTYSGYERGRSEPPIEVLVRLSYLYKVSVDMLVQRDRLAKTNDDLKKQIGELRKTLDSQQEQLKTSGKNDPAIERFMKGLYSLLDGAESIAQNQQKQDSRLIPDSKSDE